LGAEEGYTIFSLYDDKDVNLTIFVFIYVVRNYIYICPIDINLCLIIIFLSK